MSQLNREEVAERLGAYYSQKFEKETGKPAKVWADYDEEKRAYCIRGENLPAHPDLQEQHPNGWSLLDYISPTQARELIQKVRPAVKHLDHRYMTEEIGHPVSAARFRCWTYMEDVTEFAQKRIKKDSSTVVVVYQIRANGTFKELKSWEDDS